MRDTRVTEALQRLATHGYVPTMPRLALIETLMAQPSSVSARELHAILRRAYPSFGQATVYRTLEILVACKLAEAFPQHLEETRPDADSPADKRESWPDFIVDLATLELAVLKVFDGPGLEGAPSPDAGDIATLPPERLLDARPIPAPSLRLCSFHFPVHAYWLDVKRGKDPAVPLPALSFVAIARRNYRVRVHELPPAQFAFLQALDGRRTLGQALDEGIQARNGPRPPMSTLAEWLRSWSNNVFFAGLSVDLNSTVSQDSTP